MRLIISLCRVLTDYQSKMGEEYILSAFPFEHDKYQAIRILETVSTNKRNYSVASLIRTPVSERIHIPNYKVIHLYGNSVIRTVSLRTKVSG